MKFYKHFLKSAYYIILLRYTRPNFLELFASIEFIKCFFYLFIAKLYHLVFFAPSFHLENTNRHLVAQSLYVFHNMPYPCSMLKRHRFLPIMIFWQDLQSLKQEFWIVEICNSPVFYASLAKNIMCSIYKTQFRLNNLEYIFLSLSSEYKILDIIHWAS